MRLGIIVTAWLCVVFTGCGGADRPINKDLDMPKATTKDKAEPKEKNGRLKSWACITTIIKEGDES